MTDAEVLSALRLTVVPLDAAVAAAPSGKRGAAVLILIDPTAAGLPVLFMQRADDLRHHAGQIAFPGGSIEPDDAGIAAAALREAHEEVGLDPGNVEVLGTLPPLLTAVSDKWLTPVVGLQRDTWTVVPDGFEVADWFRVDLLDLMRAVPEVRRTSRDGTSRDVYFYTMGPRIIWGVTGAIVHELLTRLAALTLPEA